MKIETAQCSKPTLEVHAREFLTLFDLFPVRM